MNREVLKGITICKGHSYANDALQGVLTRLIPQNSSLVLKWCDSNIPPNERPKEWHDAVKASDALIIIFDTIVAKGSKFALDFIKRNWSLYSLAEWID